MGEATTAEGPDFKLCAEQALYVGKPNGKTVRPIAWDSADGRGDSGEACPEIKARVEQDN